MLPPDDDKPTPGDEPTGDAWVSDGKGDLLPVPSYPPDGAEMSLTSPAGLTAGPDAVQLLLALRRRWFTALAAGVLGAAAAAAALWYLLPTRQTVRALLQVHAAPPTNVFPSTEPRPDFATYQRTQSALIKSRHVLNTALRKPEVAELRSVREQLDPIVWLENQLRIDYAGGPEILRISITGDKPEEAATLVNAVTAAYLSEIADKERTRRRIKLDNVKELVRKFDESLKLQRRTLRELEERVGALDEHKVAFRQRLAEEKLADNSRKLLQAQGDAHKTRIELSVQQAKEKALANLTFSEAVVQEHLRRDVAVVRHLEKKEELEAILKAEIAKIKDPATAEKVPAIAKHRQELQTLEAALQTKQEQLRPVIEQQLRVNARQELLNAIGALQDRLALTQEYEKSLEDKVNRLHEETRLLDQGRLDLDSYRREIASDEAMVKKLKAEQDTLEVELDAPSRVTPIEEAVVSQSYDRKRQLLGALGAGGATFFGVLVLVAWLEFRTRRVNSADQVVQGLGMRLMGTLPMLPQAGRPRFSQLMARQEFNWRSVLTESVDAARTMLLHAARAQGVQVVMVTSAVGGEGKTSLSSQLAASLARAGRRVVLVDCDLRKPSAHRLFQFERGPGLSEVLRGEVELTTVLRQTRAGGLFVLTAGQGDALAIQALAQDRLGEVFERLRPDFDFIILDSCPILPVADSLLVAQHADGVVFSVLQGVSRLPAVYAAYQRLAVLGVRTLGAVVSGIPETSYGDCYRYATPTAE